MKNSLKIFYVIPEVYPFAATSDLAITGTSYPKHIKNLGHDIRVMMPNYRAVNERKYVLRDVIRLQGLKIKLADEVHNAKSKSAFLPHSKVQIYFLDNKKYFDREGMYFDVETHQYYDDTAERFIFFAIGCLETLKLLYWQPDIIHCNDWQTALIPMLLKTLYKDDSFFKGTKTFLSVYNSDDIGEVSNSIFRMIGVGDDVLDKQTKIAGSDKFSLLYAGLQYADIVSAGTPKIPSGLEKALKAVGRNKKDVSTILPPIDTHSWNAEEDKMISSNYDSQNLEGKEDCKKALLEDYDLAYEQSVPLFYSIINTDNNFDIDLFDALLKDLTKLDMQFLVGCTSRNATFKGIKEKCDNYQEKCRVKLLEDEASVHKAVSGADAFLLAPFEQNGIVNSMICLKYGTIPLFGIDFSLKEIAENGPLNQFEKSSIFSKKDIPNYLKNIKELIKAYGAKEKWQGMLSKIMSNEFSWENPAQEYIKLCQKVAHSKDISF